MHDHRQDAVYKAQEYMDLAKSMPTAPPARAPKSQVADPLSLMYSMGYKHRRHGLSYNVLRQMAQQLSVVGAIINTRVHQVASFCSPFRQADSTTRPS